MMKVAACPVVACDTIRIERHKPLRHWPVNFNLYRIVECVSSTLTHCYKNTKNRDAQLSIRTPHDCVWSDGDSMH